MSPVRSGRRSVLRLCSNRPALALAVQYLGQHGANEEPRARTIISISPSGPGTRFQSVRNSWLSGMNRASAGGDGLERCNGVRCRGGRWRRRVRRRGAAGPLRPVLDTSALVPGQHSFLRPACPRFTVHAAGPSSTTESSSHTASSARSRRLCSTWDTDCRCGSFRVELATWFSLLRW